MELREPYQGCVAKKYEDLKDTFSSVIAFKNKPISNKLNISPDEINSRVWLLYAKDNTNQWQCLQVGHSKNNVVEEITTIVDYLFQNNKQNIQKDDFTNSVFYQKVCPSKKGEEYRKFLYSSIIGNDYTEFKICFLDVDKYLGIQNCEKNNFDTDADRIIQICKNQFAEAKIAYQTLSIYWRKYSSGIDGQTLSYITEHRSEFN